MTITKGNYIETDKKSTTYTDRDEAFIKMVPLGLRFRMTRSDHLKQDVWRTARKRGWLTH